jgi:hypothetical protein
MDFLQRHCRLLVMILGAAKGSDLNCLRSVSLVKPSQKDFFEMASKKDFIAPVKAGSVQALFLF